MATLSSKIPPAGVASSAQGALADTALQASDLPPDLTQAQAEDDTSTVFGQVSGERLAQAVAASVGTTAGAVGTYCFARVNDTNDYAFGDTVSGSLLLPTSGAWDVLASSASGSVGFASGPAQAGTWRCMGLLDHIANAKDNDVVIEGATLWLRIA
ncbi:hypothetical protein N9Q05_01500 [bacterium]|nr:hypothetical protein [bacterium]MDC1342000.1 hypothetical protein [Oceanospirillaceae bacterium]